jgi:serine/threonine-protein kinase
MATVWLALERSGASEPDRLVALKAMLPSLAGEREFVCMFLDEVRLVRSIRHPNVVDVYDAGEHQGVLWMAMEWIEGESLHAVIAEAGKRSPIPTEIAVRIIADAAAGLHAAHEARDSDGALLNLVHRDVSPHNLLIGTSGEVKLVDFGVAKAMNRLSEKTRTGHLKGKFGYIAPEQVLGRHVDRRSDVFCLGVVLYELTTSRRLFKGRHDMHTLELVTRYPILLPSRQKPDYPPELERIVMRALERDPKLRYPSAAAFAEDLKEFLSEQQILVPRSGVAGLLKRVLGPNIEQRRRAARQALSTAGWLDRATEPAFISRDPAFTPTASGPHESDSVNSAAGPASSTPPPASDARPASSSQITQRPPGANRAWLALLIAMLVVASTAGYSVYESRLKTTLLSSQTRPSAASLPEPSISSPAQPAQATTKPTSAKTRLPSIKIEELEVEPAAKR